MLTPLSLWIYTYTIRIACNIYYYAQQQQQQINKKKAI